MSNLEDRARTYSMKKTSHCKCFYWVGQKRVEKNLMNLFGQKYY